MPNLVYSALVMEPIKLLNDLARHWKPIAVILALAGSALIYQAMGRTVTLDVDGTATTFFTHGRDVNAVLFDAGIELSAFDSVTPSREDSINGVELIQVRRARPVILDEVDGPRWIFATSQNPLNILSEVGLHMFPGDRLWVDGQPHGQVSAEPGFASRIRHARGYELTVLEGDKEMSFRSAAPTIGQALYEAGFMLSEGDQVDPSPALALSSNQTVRILRARVIFVTADGQTLHVNAVGETVGEALASAGVSLTGLDFAIPAVNEPIPDGSEIKVVRVIEQILTELEPVPFETTYQPLETLELDSIQVVDPGTYGVLENRIRIREEDGLEVSREVDEASVVIEPKPRILGYGTKIEVRTLSTSYGTIEYWRAIPIYATSYSPCNLGVPYCGSRTASGKEVTRGITGVIRSWYNLMRGWPVFIPNYGPGTIEDIGAGIAGRDWIDLGFTDDDFEPWHQWTTLYFLTPVPSLDSVPWILP